MKKLSLSLLAVAALGMTACSNEEGVKAPVNDGAVTFHVVVPQSIASRAISDGKTVEELYWVVFDENNHVVFEDNNLTAYAGDNIRADVSIQLVNGKKYKIAFWAQAPSAPYSLNNGVLTVDYSNAAANDEARDAFYGTYPELGSADEFFTCTSEFDPGHDIELTRPFAQVNVGTADWDKVVAHAAAPDNTCMAFTTQVATTLNLKDGTVENPVAVEFNLAALPDNDNDATTVDDLLTIDGTTYKWIGMNYILVSASPETVTKVTFKHDYENGEMSYTSIPVQRNYRTNIVGNLLTNKTDWKVVISPAYIDNKNVVIK